MIVLNYPKAKSLCECGHTGDGPGSDHGETWFALADGHGPCQVPGCACSQFTWVGWTLPFSRFLQAHQASNPA